MLGKIPRIGKGDKSDNDRIVIGVFLLQLFLQRDRVRPARQSMKVAVKHQNDRPSGVVKRTPEIRILVDEFDGRGLVANVKQFLIRSVCRGLDRGKLRTQRKTRNIPVDGGVARNLGILSPRTVAWSVLLAWVPHSNWHRPEQISNMVLA